MDEKRLIIIGVVVVILAVIAGVLLTSSSHNPNDSILDIISSDAIAQGGTVDVKLTNGEGVALRDKTVHVSVVDKNGKVVFQKDAKTYANGVANVKLAGVGAGKYNVNVTFDGDENFTASSISKEITINKAAADNNQDNNTNDTSQPTSEDTQDTSSSQSYSQSYSTSDSSSQSSQSSPSTDEGDSSTVIDENGKEVEPVIDENGKEVQ